MFGHGENRNYELWSARYRIRLTSQTSFSPITPTYIKIIIALKITLMSKELDSSFEISPERVAQLAEHCAGIQV